MPFRPILIAAIQAAALTVAGFTIPILGQVIVLFAPVPLITIAIREGRRVGLITTGAAAALVAIIVGGQMIFVLFFASLGLMALGLWEGLMRQFRPEKTVLAGGLLPILALILLLTPFLIKAGKNPVALADDYLRTSLIEAKQLYLQLGLADVAQMLEAVSDKILYYLVRLSPGIVVTTTLLQAACCYGTARSLLLRKDPGLTLDRTSLSAWHAPDQWVWGLIITLGSLVIPNTGIRIFGMNLALLYLLVYTAQGIALVEFWLRRLKISVLWRSLSHTIILTLPPLIAIIVALGVVDIWADFRKIREPHTAG